MNWTDAYLLAKKCTKSTKLIEFQFKFLHRRVLTNSFLFRIGQKDDKNCSFCHTSPESLIHLFWSCHKTSHFWNKLTEWLKNLNLLRRDYTLTNITALGLRPDISYFALLINYCFLLARYHTVAHICKHNKQFLKHNTILSKHNTKLSKHNTEFRNTSQNCRNTTQNLRNTTKHLRNTTQNWRNTT